MPRRPSRWSAPHTSSPPEPTISRAVIVLGDVLTDVLVRTPGPPTYGGDTRAAIDVRPGGSGANQAAWLAAQDVAVDLVGRVGDDPFGQFNRADLLQHGVRAHLTLDPSHATGLVVVLVAADGERTMLTDRGASRHVQPDDIPTELFSPGSHFHLSGYVLLDEPTRPAALHALDLARQAGMSVSVDPVAATLIDEVGAERFLAWTRGAQLCIPNLDEARALVGEGAPEVLAARLAEHYGEVALKMGAAGALWCRTGEQPIAAAAERASVVDTTGAGDAFCAGFLSAWLRGESPQAALSSGMRTAAKAVSQPGGRLP
jgi:sugar/nucleoside kinase (ribokinase family)